MKKVLFITIQLFFLFQITTSNAQSYEWTRSWGSTSLGSNQAVSAEDITQDELGNTYAVSYGSQTVNFSWSGNIPGVNTCGAVTKTDVNGNLIWVKFFSQLMISNNSGAFCKPSAIVYKNGNLFITGIFTGAIDFDPSGNEVSLGGYGNCFICKLNSAGDFQWASGFGSGGSQAIDLDVAPNGDIAITGYMQSQFFFAGENLTYSSGYDIFLVKYNSNGIAEWGQSFGSANTTQESGNSVKFLADNSIVLLADFTGTIDLNYGAQVSNVTSNGLIDLFLLKISNNGGYINSCSFGGTDYDTGQFLAVDSQQNIIITGRKYGAVDFDPGNSSFNLSATGSNAFITKLTTNLLFVWAKEIVAQLGSSMGFSIASDQSNNIYIAGITAGNVDFDPSINGVYYLSSVVNSITNTFLLKLNSNGIFIWAGILNNLGPTFPISNYGYSNQPSRILADNQKIYCSGQFAGPVDFNPDINVVNNVNSAVTQTGIGSQTAFILKLGQCSTTSSTQTISACTSYNWPVNNQTYNSNGVYTDTIANASGCDSIITLNLTINSPITNSSTVTSCNSYNWNGNIYNTSGVYNQVLSTSNGCDSTVTLNLTITNSPSAVVTSPDGITLNANVVPNASYQWIYCSDITPVTNQTQSQFIPQINGLYAVVVTNSCGSDTSECANVNTIGLSELDFSGISLYPNPAFDKISIGLNGEMTPRMLTVYDVQGRLLRNEVIENVSFDLSIPELSQGSYILKIEGLGSLRFTKN
jgi:hypothetical protein